MPYLLGLIAAVMKEADELESEGIRRTDLNVDEYWKGVATRFIPAA